MNDDDREFERRASARLQQELGELESPQVQGQAILNRWWGQRMAAAEEERRIKRQLDPFGLGLYD